MRAKLRTMTPTGKAPRVDRSGNGRILGVSLMAAGPALGHGFDIDQRTVEQMTALAEGLPGRWTHGNLCADGLGTHLGRWTKPRTEGDRSLADFEFSPLAKSVKPEGLSVDAATYLMDLAEKEPDMAGVSAVIDYEVEEQPIEGKPGETRRLARLTSALRADYVADPAANPKGLFSSTPSALAEQATAALAEATEIHGRERVTAFLSAYLATSNPKTTETGMTIEELKKQHAAELASRDASIAALNATVGEFKTAETKRRTDEIEGYIASLKAGALPGAIEEAKLGHVRALLAAGMDEAAKAFGSTLLANAKAGAPTGGTVVDLGAKGDTAKARANAAYTAEQLRAAGHVVELSADGTQITKNTPPAVARAGR